MKETNGLPADERDFVEFIVHGAASVAPADLEALLRELPALRARFESMQPPGFPQAPAQLAFLAQVVETFASGKGSQIPYVAVAEAAFALLYLQRDVDVIPDFVPEVGLVDDAAVAATVLARHPAVFGQLALQQGTDWSQIDSTREQS